MRKVKDIQRYLLHPGYMTCNYSCLMHLSKAAVVSTRLVRILGYRKNKMNSSSSLKHRSRTVSDNVSVSAVPF